MSYQSFGSPIDIAANALQISFKDLHKIRAEKLGEHKAKQ